MSKQSIFSLDIASKIVKEFDGSISFQTKLREGASFSFCIPLEKAIDSKNGKRNSSQAIQVPQTQNDSCNVEVNDVTIDVDDMAFSKIGNLTGTTNKGLLSQIKNQIEERDGMEEESSID